MIDFQRRPTESEQEYVFRICQMKDEIGTWKDVANILNNNLGYSYDESRFRKQFQSYNKMFEATQHQHFDDEYLDNLREQQMSLQKERYKVQTEKVEYNRWLREDARDELFIEQVINAIKDNKTSPTPTVEPIKGTVNNDLEHGLFFADAHFGKEFKIYGLYNEVINEYSPDIFFSRMEKLLSETVLYIQKENISKLKVFNLGDSLDGFLRHSQLWTLRYGVVESAIVFSKYMAKWFRELSKYVCVEYHPTKGNHTELRLLDGKKGAHEHENIEDIINTIIEIYNEDNPNFKLVQNKTGLIFTQMAGYNLLGVHGEVKDLPQALKNFADIYNTQIDIIVAGHKHHATLNNCGYRKNAIGVGSVVGSDDFSMKIVKQADAAANIITFQKGKGKVNDKTIILN